MERTLNTRMTDEQIKTLESIGFKRWTKYGKDRLYPTDRAIGLECEYYKSGNISSATFNGEDISNCEARRISCSISGAYVDIETSAIVYSDKRGCERIAAAIERA